MGGSNAMFSRTKPLVVPLLGLMLSTGLASKAGTRSPDDALPSLDAVKAVHYAQTTNSTQTDTSDHSALLNVINACQSYSNRVNVLSSFHEPILTRGDTGIAVFRKVSPSVVLVVAAKFKDDKVTDSALGTGVIVDPAGYVLTNWHVVSGFDGAIIFFKPSVGTEPAENSAYGVKVIAMDEETDLALLKIVKPPSGLPAVQLGSLSAIQVAEDIHIIGHPHGKLWSYSSGVISQVRDHYDWKYEDGSKHLARVLQMQTAINPGNSGGPVLDNDSKLLGLVAMSEEGQNLNYAIAIDVIKNFVNNSLHDKTRGSVPFVKSEVGVSYQGRSREGLSITKIVYADFISYTVSDAKGLPVEVFAEMHDGSVLAGSEPNAFGGFGTWTFKPASGKTVLVRSSGIYPDIISLAPGN
jgi:S1-C subfamily serine protease